MSRLAVPLAALFALALPAAAAAPAVYAAYRKRDREMWDQVTKVLRLVREAPSGQPAAKGPPAPGRSR